MASKTIIAVSVIVSISVAAGVAVLIWWLVRDPTNFTVIASARGSVRVAVVYPFREKVAVIRLQELGNDGLGDVTFSAAFTRIDDVGDVFWWFYPTTAAAATSRPILLWLDGVTGLPPSMLANFGMFGPYDFNMNKRENSWVDEYNLLFVDAPIGTGFSTPLNTDAIPKSFDENADHLVSTLRSFYQTHKGYSNAPLYIFGQGSGAQLALGLAARLPEVRFTHNLQGVVLANGIVSPALVLTKLGFYLEQLGYIDNNERPAVESLSIQTTYYVQQERFEEAMNNFLSLGESVNAAGAVAVNLGHIVEKLTNSTNSARGPDHFGQMTYLRSLISDAYYFMDNTVANALGITTPYDISRAAAIAAVKDTFMIPTVDKVEHILQNTSTTVTIYNGNLDAVSNTPGQLEWVNDLQWNGHEEFTNSTRETFVVNRVIEGYFRGTERLKFYWINAAGQSVPIDSPVAMRRLLQLVTGQ